MSSVFAKLGPAKYAVRSVPYPMMASAGYAAHNGVCDPPWRVDPEIWLLDTLRGKEQLRVLLHEAMHAQDWNAREKVIDRDSDQLATLLWEFGYRLR